LRWTVNKFLKLLRLHLPKHFYSCLMLLRGETHYHCDVIQFSRT
jgi:hypothetical protein